MQTISQPNICTTNSFECITNKQLTNTFNQSKNNMSTIDVMVDAFLANRHKFPGKDPSNIKKIEDKRTPVQKMSDVINTCNQKISPELVPEWERLCGRSIVEPCYYKSG